MCLIEAKILNKNIIITNTASNEVVKNYSKKIILENTENDIFEGLKSVLKKEFTFENNESYVENEYGIEKIEKLFK